MKKAKVKRIVISPQVLFEVWKTGSAWRVENGIPKGASFRGITQDPHTQNWHLFVSHPTFEEVDIESEITPQLETLFRKIA